MAYIGKSIESGTFSVLDTSGNTYNGSNVTFNLGTQVGSPAQLLVSHDGVIQKPGTDYSLASGGTQITFSTAPASGASIFIVEISGAVGGPLDSDLNGNELILDADGDTSITADTDDQIDIKIANADHVKLTSSSGVFTFPSTGVYFITYQTYFNAAVGETEINALIQHTTNNGGAWSDNTKFACGEANDGGYVGGYGSTVIDIGDVSNHKVRFTVDMSNTATNMIGDSSRNQVAVTFIRLGDT